MWQSVQQENTVFENVPVYRVRQTLYSFFVFLKGILDILGKGEGVPIQERKKERKKQRKKERKKQRNKERKKERNESMNHV